MMRHGSWLMNDGKPIDDGKYQEVNDDILVDAKGFQLISSELGGTVANRPQQSRAQLESVCDRSGIADGKDELAQIIGK